MEDNELVETTNGVEDTILDNVEVVNEGNNIFGLIIGGIALAGVITAGIMLYRKRHNKYATLDNVKEEIKVDVEEE